MQTIEVDHPDRVGEDRRAMAQAIRALGDADLLRLETIARLRARGLPFLDSADLLNEAILRALDGARHRPPGVPLVAFLAMTMRSVAAAHWRRLRQDRLTFMSAGPGSEDSARRQADDAADIDPERCTAARQALAALDQLFAQDEVALKIIAGLAGGLSAAEIRIGHSLSPAAYDAARKRMRRALLRDARMGIEP